MRSNKKKPDSTDREVRTMRSLSGAAQDPASQQLGRVAGKLGNQDLAARLGDSAAARDRLMAFITARLKTLRDVQVKERLEMKDHRQWFREVARGQDGYHLPDATRWHEAARRYRRAGEALARGDLARGARLIEQATEAERAAFSSTPRQVQEELDPQERSAAAAPDEAAHYAAGGTSCPATALPSELRRHADAILRSLDEMEDSPPITHRRRWWEGPEEEEEEEEDDGDEG